MNQSSILQNFDLEKQLDFAVEEEEVEEQKIIELIHPIPVQIDIFIIQKSLLIFYFNYLGCLKHFNKKLVDYCSSKQNISLQGKALKEKINIFFLTKNITKKLISIIFFFQNMHQSQLYSLWFKFNKKAKKRNI